MTYLLLYYTRVGYEGQTYPLVFFVRPLTIESVKRGTGPNDLKNTREMSL